MHINICTSKTLVYTINFLASFGRGRSLGVYCFYNF